jgi:O-antigen ligase
MTGERFALDGGASPARVVSLARPPLTLPVGTGPALGWGLIALTIANLGRIPLLPTGSRTAAIVLNDVAVAGIGCFGILAAILRRRLILDSVAFFGLAFAAVGFVSAVSGVQRFGFSTTQLLVGLSYLARWLMYFGVYLFVINNVRARQVEDIWRVLLKVMLVFSVFGIFQSIFLPGFAQMVYPDSKNYVDWDPQGHRLVSTVLEPNIAAAMIVLVLLILLARVSFGAREPWWKPAILLAALAMTLSRSGALALVVGLAVVLIARGISLRLIRLMGAIVFLALALLPRLLSFAQQYSKFEVGANTSAGARVGSWLAAIDALTAHPVIGVGFNTFGFYRELQSSFALEGASSYGTDGGVLFAAAMTGLVGVALYLAMYVAVVRRARRIWKNTQLSPELRGLACGVAAGAIAICVHALFVNSIFTTFVMEMMWVTWGFLFVIEQNPPPDFLPAT